MKIRTGDLATALAGLAKIRARKLKVVAVTLERDSGSGQLSVAEAKHGLFAELVAMTGEWLAPVQVDGTILARLAASLPAEAEAELHADTHALHIRCGATALRIPRLDGGGTRPVASKPIPPNRRHKGKVVVPPDPTQKRVELADTWGFSARVPMPQHRDPGDGDKEG